MAESSTKPNISLRILVDKEKNKVVLAEAGQDFVDVLFGFLKLQMGTIVRLVNKQPHQTPVGCFSNIYKSVSDMEIDNFLTEACKTMLLYPRSLDDHLLQRLKINVNENAHEAGKFFICPGYKDKKLCSSMWASFSTSKCRCGKKMDMEMKLEGENAGNLGNDVDGVFVHRQPSFIITDDMIVQSYSIDFYLKVVKDQGYKDLDKLSEALLVIGSEEVFILLDCLFSSDSPVTDAFLRKRSHRDTNRLQHKTLTPALQGNRNVVEPGRLTLNVVVRKQDGKVLYFECREDFVNLLFTFLALSLEFVVEKASGGIMSQGCISNLLKSYNRVEKQGPTSKLTLPWFHSCQKNLLDINTNEPPVLVFNSFVCSQSWLRRWSGDSIYGDVKMSTLNPICHHKDQQIGCNECKGFVKGNMKFRVTDDLIVTPLSSSSNVAYLKQLQVSLDDLDVQEISIGKVEVNNVLRTCFMTSTVLSTAFCNLLVKKPKEET